VCVCVVCGMGVGVGVYNNLCNLCSVNTLCVCVYYKCINRMIASQVYMSPERIQVGKYTSNCDVWSLRIVQYSIETRVV
jgi:serine/threonine protein kinase